MPDLYCPRCDIWWPTFNPDTDPFTDIRCPDCNVLLRGPPAVPTPGSDADPDTPYFHARHSDSCMYPW